MREVAGRASAPVPPDPKTEVSAPDSTQQAALPPESPQGPIPRRPDLPDRDEIELAAPFCSPPG